MTPKHDAETLQTWQTRHDKLYWAHGKCCAGCDHWRCFSIKLGRCGRSLHMPGPDAWSHIFTGPVFGVSLTAGQLVTRETYVCGQFRDDFDWSTLPPWYLRELGAATKRGRMLPKPAHELEEDMARINR